MLMDRKTAIRIFVSIPYGVSSKDRNRWRSIYSAIVDSAKEPSSKYESHLLTPFDSDYAFTCGIKENVKKLIETCDLLIAVLATTNPNVFWEMGYAEGIGLPIITINHMPKDVPVLASNPYAINCDLDKIGTGENSDVLRQFLESLSVAIDSAADLIIKPRLDTDTRDLNQFDSLIKPEITAKRMTNNIFLGYCNQSHRTALLVKDFISVSFPEARIIDWKWDFRTGQTLIEELERVSNSVAAAVFLVTKDDLLQASDAAQIAIPRDNILFEIGYFAARLGRHRTILIVEVGAKMPSDLGGVLFIPLNKRDETKTIETQLYRVLKMQT
jgi:predicted nucleotide-binding protein